MNKYITVLLVALAATGVEAQDYQFVLRVALGNIGYSEVHNLPVDNGIKSNILSIIAAYKKVNEETGSTPTMFIHSLAATKVKVYPIRTIKHIQNDFLEHQNPSLSSSIRIRAPSMQ